MPGLTTAAALTAGTIATYYGVTFALWVGHWFAHLEGSPLRSFHVEGHHRLYDTTDSPVRTERFRFASGREDSNVAMLPWLFAMAGLALWLLPTWLALYCLAHEVLLIGLYSWLHLQFHLTGTPLARWRWFRRARAAHDLHHVADVNFMIVDPFWDRVMRTWRPAEATP